MYADGKVRLDEWSRIWERWVAPFLEKWASQDRQPYPAPAEVAELRTLLQDLQGEGAPPEGYSWLPEFLARLAVSLRFNERNFVNVHPCPLIPAVLASTVVALQNPNNIVGDVSEATTQMEAECIAWMAEELVGFQPSKAWGSVVSGGTIGNLTALMVARDYSFRKLSLPKACCVRTRGLAGLPAGVVLATAGCHYSVSKALWVLGMGDENLTRIPVAFDEAVARRVRRDESWTKGISKREWRAPIQQWLKTDKDRGREELRRFYNGEQQPFSLQPLNSEVYKALYACFEYGTPLIAYVFTIGTTDTGTIEEPDQEALIRLREEDVFVHADIASAGFALQHDRVKKRVDGLSHVHSCVIDGHKLGQLHYPNSTVLFRERSWMYEILHEAPYLKDLAPTLEGSRPGSNVAALWAAIEGTGKTGGYVALVDRLFHFVDALCSAFEASGSFQVLHRVDLTTVAVAPLPRPGERRIDVNWLVTRMHEAIVDDRNPGAFLVNLDRELAGIQVRDSNRYRGPLEEDEDPLVSIRCLRIVVCHPAVEPRTAGELVAYLERVLGEARARRSRR